MDWIEEMGVRIKELRKSKGLKQWQLAQMIHVVPHQV